ncbi:hypothetical protein LSAT2_012008 [Lamellibrachia satsuma]|nr:hypothetical protein LSAT2_012008 [Lamellibrachia satsuma]
MKLHIIMILLAATLLARSRSGHKQDLTRLNRMFRICLNKCDDTFNSSAFMDFVTRRSNSNMTPSSCSTRAVSSCLIYATQPLQSAHATTAIDRNSLCIDDEKSWMVFHNLLLNECKMEAVVISAGQNSKCVQPPVDLVIDVFGCSVTPKPFIRDTTFAFDDTISMAAHIRRVCQVACCHIRGIATIRKCLSTTACKKIIHALVMLRLDYGKAMLYGLSETQTS